MQGHGAHQVGVRSPYEVVRGAGHICAVWRCVRLCGSQVGLRAMPTEFPVLHPPGDEHIGRDPLGRRACGRAGPEFGGTHAQSGRAHFGEVERHPQEGLPPILLEELLDHYARRVFLSSDPKCAMDIARSLGMERARASPTPMVKGRLPKDEEQLIEEPDRIVE